MENTRKEPKIVNYEVQVDLNPNLDSNKFLPITNETNTQLTTIVEWDKIIHNDMIGYVEKTIKEWNVFIVYLRSPSWKGLWRFVLDESRKKLKTIKIWDKELFIEYISFDWKRALCKSEYWVELWFFVLNYDNKSIMSIKVWNEEYLVSWISDDWKELVWVSKNFEYEKRFKKTLSWWWKEVDSKLINKTI